MEKFDVRTKEGRQAHYKKYQQLTQESSRIYYHKHRDAILKQRNAEQWKYKAYQAIYYMRNKDALREKRLKKICNMNDLLKSTTVKFDDYLNVKPGDEPLAIFKKCDLPQQIDNPIFIKLNVSLSFD